MISVSGMPIQLQRHVLEKTIRNLAVDFPRLDAEVIIQNADVWFDSTLTYYENKESLARYLTENWGVSKAAVLTQTEFDAESESHLREESRLSELRALVDEDPAFKPAIVGLAREYGVHATDISGDNGSAAVEPASRTQKTLEVAAPPISIPSGLVSAGKPGSRRETLRIYYLLDFL